MHVIRSAQFCRFLNSAVTLNSKSWECILAFACSYIAVVEEGVALLPEQVRVLLYDFVPCRNGEVVERIVC